MNSGHVTITKKVSYVAKRLPKYGLLMINNTFYNLKEVTEFGNTEIFLRKIMGDTSIHIKVPKPIEIKIPKGKKIYEIKSAYICLVSQKAINIYKKAGDVMVDSKLLKTLGTIPVIWHTGMDGTVWTYDPKSKMFKPVPTIRYIKFHRADDAVDFDLEKVIKISEKASWYAGHKWYDEHCQDCGGRTLRIDYQETEKTAASTTIDTTENWAMKDLLFKKARKEG